MFLWKTTEPVSHRFLGVAGNGEDFLLTNQVQSSLATASSDSRSEQKNKDSHYSHHSCRERGESEESFIVIMYNINHCMPVKSILCTKFKKLVNEKIFLHYAFSASSAKVRFTTGSRTAIHCGECFTSLIPPPVYFFIYVFFFFSCKVVKILSEIPDASQPTFD